MRFFRRIAGLLGFARDDGHEVKDQENDHENNNNNRPIFQETGLPRRGFGVPVQVAVDRPQPGPVLLPCTSGDGGVQGLKWYAKRLRIDEDGDVADEFLDEVLQETSGAASAENEQKPFPKFEVKYSTRPAKVKTQIMSHDGKIQQCVENQGRLQWFLYMAGCCTSCAVRVKSGQIRQPEALGISAELKEKVSWLQFGRYFARGPIERDDYALELAMDDE